MPTNKSIELEYLGRSSEYDITRFNNEKHLMKYKSYVFWMTFISYMSFHLSRKAYSNIKSELTSIHTINDGLLSKLDGIFMLTYAVGNIMSGKYADKWHAPSLLGIGLIGSGICLLLFTLGIYQSDNSDAYHVGYVIIFGLNGLFHSICQPANVSIMGNWYGPQDRGKIFGIWSMNQYIGNIFAAVIVSIVIYNHNNTCWIWALIIPSLFNIIWGLTCIIAIPQAPEDIGIETELSIIKKSYFTSKSIIENIEASNSIPSELRPIVSDNNTITLCDALRIPRVITYIIAFSLYKYINYIIFFWLPFYLALRYKLVESILITILYDVGMMPSAYMVEVITEKLNCRRACVIVSYIICLCPLLYVFANISTDTSPETVDTNLLVLLGAMGFLVGGPNSIITSAVAADLADSPEIKGNAKALGTLTGMINGVGSLVAATGLLFVTLWIDYLGWQLLWYSLIVCAIVGSLTLSHQVYKEIFYHGIHNTIDVNNFPPPMRGYESISRTSY